MAGDDSSRPTTQQERSRRCEQSESAEARGFTVRTYSWTAGRKISKVDGVQGEVCLPERPC